ncbi:hypothetical protein B0T24DRAFT_594406 [Lasiosphaeria ovina]|uniref:Uncharacterized protein n=1 Tax=Lasiosphaeria ovina TaxID=92902 RepID=A0AAE0KCI8_9PEZI|nr:hypothetical protein B0T24DRAFT_594406 [Lasiosphaeria ovina]
MASHGVIIVIAEKMIWNGSEGFDSVRGSGFPTTTPENRGCDQEEVRSGEEFCNKLRKKGPSGAGSGLRWVCMTTPNKLGEFPLKPIRTVAVVGAGISVVAHMMRAGLSVTVFERSAASGGVFIAIRITPIEIFFDSGDENDPHPSRTRELD